MYKGVNVDSIPEIAGLPIASFAILHLCNVSDC
jgi:hypothetical protein